MEQKTTRRQIAKRPLYREEIKEALMEAIISGEIAPGDRIVETRWARELGVSQSPIREAIRELEMIGMVENIPYKGCVVRKLTLKDIIDTYSIRVALESMAAEDIMNSDTEALLADMQDSLDEMLGHAKNDDVRGFTESDVKFHEAFVECSKNELLKKLWQQCYIYDNTKISTIFSNLSMVELAERHKLICDAIREKDAERFRREISMHFTILIDSLSEMQEEA